MHSNETPPWPIPSPGEKAGGLSVGPAPPPRNKTTRFTNVENIARTLTVLSGVIL